MTRDHIIAFVLLLSFAPVASIRARAAESAATTAQALPGSGLAQHDFLYAGESKNRRAFIVRNGKVVWSYDDPAGRGEVSDAVMLSNGNLLLAHQFAVKLVSPEQKVLWNLDAPRGTEIHTATPIGREHVHYVLRSWENPDLGPATTIQILDESEAPEQVSFGDIK